MTGIIRVFAYGSLMNEKSLRGTVADAKNARAARVAGYRRVFNAKSSRRVDPISGKHVCVLNLEPSDEDNFVNGVVFEMGADYLARLRQREGRYEMGEVVAAEYGGNRAIGTALAFIAQVDERYRYLIDSSEQDRYLRLCVKGCLRYGSKFLEDFMATTSFWGLGETEVSGIWLRVVQGTKENADRRRS